MAIPKITQTFNPGIGEYGQDYATPVGSPIYSPIAGIIGTEDKGKQDWGKRVIVTATDTATKAAGIAAFAVGHLTSFAVTPGQQVKVGQLLGYSGGATSDPSSGNSTGPHVEPQFYNANHQPINPTSVFSRFSSWEQAIFSGAPAASSGSGPSWNPLTGFGPGPDAINPLAGVPEAITSATNNLGAAATRGAWFLFGFGLFVVGLLLIFFGDIEKAADKVGDVVEKIAPAAEAVAA